MGILDILRRARVVRQASALMERNLLTRNGLAWQVPARNAGREIVLALWRSGPELAASSASINPALLAAGALADAIVNARRVGDLRTAEGLHSSLFILWIEERGCFESLQNLSAPDRQLFHQARAVLRNPITPD